MSRVHSTFLFEISFEVANFVGGIHTVLATKARQIQQHIPNYLLIGPFIANSAKQEFLQSEPPTWMKKHIAKLKEEGIIVHYGTWDVAGTPKCILLEFSSQFHFVNTLKAELYEKYNVESHDGGFDVNEPIAFSFAASKVIAEFSQSLLNDFSLITHAHEWMCGYTNLFLKIAKIEVKSVFTTHATMLGRTITTREPELAKELFDEKQLTYNPRDKAAEYGILAKHTAEVACAKVSDVFTTVSEITGREATFLLGTKPQCITFNGINADELYPLTHLANQQKTARKAIERIAKCALGNSFTGMTQTQYWVTSGRHETSNKGYDLTIEAIAKLQKETTQQIILFILVPFEVYGANAEFAARLDANQTTGHAFRDLIEMRRNEINDLLDKHAFFNQPHDSVKIIYVPEYLNNPENIFGLTYNDLLTGFDLGIFPSHYEPWGYTPHECIASATSVVTSNTAGFGAYIQKHISEKEVVLIHREKPTRLAQIEELRAVLCEKASRSKDMIHHEATLARIASSHCEWKRFILIYLDAYGLR